MARARANLLGAFPRGRRNEIAFPKRPSPALTRPSGINGAANGRVVEDAVVFQIVSQRSLAVHVAGVQTEHFLNRFAAEFRNRFDLGFVDPNISRKTRTAFAATGAFKAQAIFVPEIGHDETVVSGQWSVVSGQWSVVSGQWSVVSRNCIRMTANYRPPLCKTSVNRLAMVAVRDASNWLSSSQSSSTALAVDDDAIFSSPPDKMDSFAPPVEE